MAVDIEYISNFLNKPGVEGARQTRGYIPARPGNFYGKPNQKPSDYVAIGASGVTIATGCDLGQTDAASLKGYGASDKLISLFKPYLGLKKSAAIHALSAAPLSITEEEAAALDVAVHTGYFRRYVLPAYQKDAVCSFDRLPKQAQAVVFSVCYQKGCGGVRKDWPKLWYALTHCDWAGASRELLTGFKQYTLRRSIEGKLLKELL